MLQSLIHLDIIILNLIRGLVNPSAHWEVLLVKIMSDSEVILVALFLLGLWLYGIYKKQNSFKETALYIFWMIVCVMVLYTILNNAMPYRPRPESVSAIKPLFSHVPDNSFPSGHGLFLGASVFALFVFLERKWIGWVALVIGIGMLLSRVMAGIHYPGDVLVGFLLGLITAAIFYPFEKKAFFQRYCIEWPIKIAKFIKL